MCYNCRYSGRILMLLKQYILSVEEYLYQYTVLIEEKVL